MEYQSLIITHLHRVWDEQVEAGYISWDEMHDSLFDQVTGGEDMSADELDEPIARLLGWDISNMSTSQWKIWRDIVVMAAREWISR
jgi:hypothetical protein